MSFENLSNSIWQEMQSGTGIGHERDTGPFTIDFYGESASQGIDFLKLARYLKDHLKTSPEIYYRPDYEKGFTSHEETILLEHKNYTSTIITPSHIPFTYKNDLGETVTTKLSGLLNKRVDYLDPSWAYIIQIDPTRSKIVATLQVFYANTNLERVPATDTITPNDFTIADQYMAISLSTENLTDFCYLIRDLFGEGSSAGIQGKIAERYAERLKAITEASLLNYLYGTIPEFAYPLIPDYMEYAVFEKHLGILQSYDDTGFFSWFKDSSGPVINLFRLMCNGEPMKLFKTMRDNPVLLKRIYYNLDGTSTIGQATDANYVIFANLLHALCVVNGFDGLERKAKTFYIGKQYELDSNVLQGNDDQPKKIFLKQFKKTTLTRTETDMDEFGINTGSFDVDYEVTNPMGTGAYYLPLDLVMLVDMDSKDKTPVMVPAIFIKAISDKEEWKDIKKNIRIGMDVLAIIIGIASLGTASPLAFALAAADVGLAATDIAVALNEDALMKTPEGRQFLENWDKIMLIGGIITAGPAIVNSTFKLGTKLLSKATLIETQNFLKGSLLKMIRETNTFIRAEMTIIADLAKEFGASSLTANLNKLYQEGVLIMKSAQQQVSEYILLYKNEALLMEDLKGLRKEVSAIFSTSGSTLLAKIDAFVFALRKTRTVVNTGAKIGEKLTDQAKAWGTVQMKLMKDEYEEVLKFLADRNIRLVETTNINDVYYMETKVIDKSEKVIAVEKTLSVHPEMRFLDLQHEIDHIVQLEKNLKGEFCTAVKREGTMHYLPDNKAARFGKLNTKRMDFIEFENRVREIKRLKQKNVAQKLIDEHVEGILEYEKRYSKYKLSENKWIEQYFPDFTPTY